MVARRGVACEGVEVSDESIGVLYRRSYLRKKMIVIRSARKLLERHILKSNKNYHLNFCFMISLSCRGMNPGFLNVVTLFYYYSTLMFYKKFRLLLNSPILSFILSCFFIYHFLYFLKPLKAFPIPSKW